MLPRITRSVQSMLQELALWHRVSRELLKSHARLSSEGACPTATMTNILSVPKLFTTLALAANSAARRLRRCCSNVRLPEHHARR